MLHLAFFPCSFLFYFFSVFHAGMLSFLHGISLWENKALEINLEIEEMETNLLILHKFKLINSKPLVLWWEGKGRTEKEKHICIR